MSGSPAVPRSGSAFQHDVPWPSIPTVDPPSAETARRSWGAISHDQRYRLQHDSLLRITRQLAEEKGYDGTQIAQVVALAGVSRRTFYEHFGSKEGCFSELLVRATAVGMKILTDAAEQSLEQGPYATFLAMIEAWADMMNGQGTFPMSRTLRRGLWRESQRPDSKLATAMEQIIAVGGDIFFAASRRLGSPLPDELLRLAGRQQLVALLGAIEPREGTRHVRDHQLLANVLTVGFGFAPEHIAT